MSEKIPRIENKGILSDQEKYYLDQERLFADDYSTIEVEQLSPEQCAEKIQELEARYTAFEQKHPLDILNAIQAHTIEEALENETRKAAKEDLPAIVSLRNLLGEQKNISPEVLQRLHMRYQRIQASVGVFNNGQLDHSIR